MFRGAGKAVASEDGAGEVLLDLVRAAEQSEKQVLTYYTIVLQEPSLFIVRPILQTDLTL